MKESHYRHTEYIIKPRLHVSSWTAAGPFPQYSGQGVLVSVNSVLHDKTVLGGQAKSLQHFWSKLCRSRVSNSSGLVVWISHIGLIHKPDPEPCHQAHKGCLWDWKFGSKSVKSRSFSSRSNRHSSHRQTSESCGNKCCHHSSSHLTLAPWEALQA